MTAVPEPDVEVSESSLTPEPVSTAAASVREVRRLKGTGTLMKNYLEIYSLENKSDPVCRADGARLIQDDHDPHGVTKRRESLRSMRMPWVDGKKWPKGWKATFSKTAKVHWFGPGGPPPAVRVAVAGSVFDITPL